ncbi:hypothetical protein ALC53_09825 [Atta colombica]|uniref:Uncharacterized protein n=1 Tax=Atta colombica TaxID=520822 RepID=A0A195B5C8_9HYME|nr:hypothetical protein ALC53_09825 [Atta colombica]
MYFQDLLTRFWRHNSTVRQDALKQLKDILLQLNSLLHGIATLTLDKEKEIRTNSFHALNFILSVISNEQLTFLREVNYRKLCIGTRSIMPPFVKMKKYIPVYSDSVTQFCEINLDEDVILIDNREKETLSIEEFVKYINLLPLMSDIWLEICPDEKVESYTEITIKIKPLINESRKHQKDFSQMEFTEGCLEQNLEVHNGRVQQIQLLRSRSVSVDFAAIG